MLIQTLVPAFSTLLAWVSLGEVLTPVEALAMAVTMAGVAWVVGERKGGQARDEPALSRKQYVVGILLAGLGALGQASGLVVAKPALSGGLPTLSATVMRMVVGATVIWIVTLIRRQAGPTWRALSDRKAFWTVAGGTVIGPVIGIWLSMVAIQRADVGLASALMSLTPILLLFPSHWIFHEKITPRSIVGTVVALAGATTILLV